MQELIDTLNEVVIKAHFGQLYNFYVLLRWLHQHGYSGENDIIFKKD